MEVWNVSASAARAAGADRLRRAHTVPDPDEDAPFLQMCIPGHGVVTMANQNAVVVAGGVVVITIVIHDFDHDT